MKKAIICHLCNFKPEYGGTFIDSLLFLNRYCQNKLQVGIFSIFPDQAKNRKWLRKLDDEEIGYGFVPRTRNVASYIPHLLHDYHPLIFHTHFFLYDLSAIFLKALFYRDSKIVWHYHNPTELTVKQRIKDTCKIKLSFNYLGDRCIAVGDGVYKSLGAAGLSREKTVLIHNAINTSRFLNNSEDSSELRESLGISKEDMVFVLLGWDPVRKGVDIFFRAAEETCRRNKSNCKYLVLGRTETRAFVSKLLCNSNLTYDALRVIDPIEDFSLLLKGVDVLVSASRSEGLSYSVLEAMTAGKLILSSDIASVRETYGKSKAVWLFPTEDWKALSGLMERAVGLSPAERKSLGQANSQYVLENHSLERWAERIVQVYKELLNN